MRSPRISNTKSRETASSKAKLKPEATTKPSTDVKPRANVKTEFDVKHEVDVKPDLVEDIDSDDYEVRLLQLQVIVFLPPRTFTHLLCRNSATD
jgi:hypothetical protein